MKISTKLVSAAAVAAVTLMAAGCGGSTTPVETFAEAEDPVAADSTAWDGVRKGLNAMWGQHRLPLQPFGTPRLAGCPEEHTSDGVAR